MTTELVVPPAGIVRMAIRLVMAVPVLVFYGLLYILIYFFKAVEILCSLASEEDEDVLSVRGSATVADDDIFDNLDDFEEDMAHLTLHHSVFDGRKFPSAPVNSSGEFE